MNRARKFLEYKFGPDRRNGNMIASLLEEYRLWSDPDEDSIEGVLHYCEQMGFDRKTNEWYVIDNRYYLCAYMMYKFNSKAIDLARHFKIDHSSLSVALSKMIDKKDDRTFLFNTHTTRQKYYVELDVLCTDIRMRRKLRGNFKGKKHRKLDAPLKDNHFKMIKHLIHRDCLYGKLEKRSGLTWKRYFLFNEAVSRGDMSLEEVGVMFGVVPHTVSLGYNKFNDGMTRSFYNKELSDYDEIFKSVKYESVD